MQTIVEWLARFGISLPSWFVTVVASGFLVTAAKLFWELAQFYRSLRKEAQERIASAAADRRHAYEMAYWRLEDRYWELLSVNIRYPGMRVALTDDDATPVSEEDRIRRRIFYEMLFSLFERAYLDRDLTPEIRKHQWPGWEEYIESYMRKPSCRAEWSGGANYSTGYGLDERFQSGCMAPILERIERDEAAEATQAAAPAA
jgi:hypothetical protein